MPSQETAIVFANGIGCATGYNACLSTKEYLG
jgi:hypothetical protein